MRGNRCLLLCRKVVAEVLQECRCVRPRRQVVGDGGQAGEKLRGELADQFGVVKIYAAYCFVFRRKQAFPPIEAQRAVVLLFGIIVRQTVIHVKIILPAVHAFFYAAAPDGISQEDIDRQDGTLQDALWSGEAAEYDVPVQPSNPDGDNWLDGQSLLYRLGYELSEQAACIGEETGDDTAYDTARADFENAVIAAMQQCDREGVFGNRAENGLLLFAYYADADDEHKPEAEQLLHRSAKALNGKKGYDRIVAVGTEQ